MEGGWLSRKVRGEWIDSFIYFYFLSSLFMECVFLFRSNHFCSLSIIIMTLKELNQVKKVIKYLLLFNYWGFCWNASPSYERTHLQIKNILPYVPAM